MEAEKSPEEFDAEQIEKFMETAAALAKWYAEFEAQLLKWYRDVYALFAAWQREFIREYKKARRNIKRRERQERIKRRWAWFCNNALPWIGYIALLLLSIWFAWSSLGQIAWR